MERASLAGGPFHLLGCGLEQQADAELQIARARVGGVADAGAGDLAKVLVAEATIGIGVLRRIGDVLKRRKSEKSRLAKPGPVKALRPMLPTVF